MIRIPGWVAVALATIFLVGVACIQELERGGTPTPGTELVTPSPTATPTPTLAPTVTPTVISPTPSLTPVPPTVPVPTPTPTQSPTPIPSTRVPTPTPGPEPTEPPEPTQTPLPTVSPTATPVPEPTVEPPPDLQLVVRAPSDGTSVSTDAVVVHGDTIPGATVEIGGIDARVGLDGRFQLEVPLVPGTNLIQVVATGPAGNSQSRVLNITSLAFPAQPFRLRVIEPEDQSIVSNRFVRITGLTGTDATAIINGVTVAVDELGFFFTVVVLEEGSNIIEVVAANIDGRVLIKEIALIYRPPLSES